MDYEEGQGREVQGDVIGQQRVLYAGVDSGDVPYSQVRMNENTIEAVNAIGVLRSGTDLIGAKLPAFATFPIRIRPGLGHAPAVAATTLFRVAAPQANAQLVIDDVIPAPLSIDPANASGTHTYLYRVHVQRKDANGAWYDAGDLCNEASPPNEWTESHHARRLPRLRHPARPDLRREGLGQRPGQQSVASHGRRGLPQQGGLHVRVHAGCGRQVFPLGLPPPVAATARSPARRWSRCTKPA